MGLRMMESKFLFLFLSIFVFAKCGETTVKVACQTVLSGGHQDPEGVCDEPEGHLLTCGTSTSYPCPALANINDITGATSCGQCLTLDVSGTTINVIIVGKVDDTDDEQTNRPDAKYYLTPLGLTALGQGSPSCYDPTTQDACSPTCSEMDATETAAADCAFGVSCLTDMENDSTLVCTDTESHDEECGTKYNPCPIAQAVPGATVPTDGCDECFNIKTATKEIYVRLVGKLDIATAKSNEPDAKYFLSKEGLEALGGTPTTCYDYGADTAGTGTIIVPAVSRSEAYKACSNYGAIGCQDVMGASTDPADECSDEKEGDLTVCGGDAEDPCPLVANIAKVEDDDDCGLCLTLETEADTPVKKHFQILGKVDTTTATNRPNNKYFTSQEGLKALGETTPACYAVSADTCTTCTVMNVGQESEDCHQSFSVGCQDAMDGDHVDPEKQCSAGPADMGECGEAHNPCPAVAHIADLATDEHCGECTILKHAQKSIHIEILGKATNVGDGNTHRPRNKYYLTSKGMEALGQSSPVCYNVATPAACPTCSQLEGVREMKDIAACKFPVGCFTDMKDDGHGVCTGTSAHDDDCGTKYNPCPVTLNAGTASPGTDGCNECFKLKADATHEIFVHAVGKADTSSKTNDPKAKYFVSSAALVKLGASGSPTCYNYGADTASSPTLIADVEKSADFATCPNYLNLGCQTTMGDDTDPANACTDQDEGALTACGTGENSPCPIVANQADVAGTEKCGQCLELESEDGTKVKAEILGKVAIGSSNRPVNKYYTSPAGVTALGGGSSPSCYDVSDDSCSSCTQMHIAEEEEACGGEGGISIGCQTTMTEVDVDPEGECDEGAGHLETCGEDFNPCPAVANINDISGGTSCGDCVVLTKGTATVHIQILGKADDTESGMNRPDFKYYLSPEGLKKLSVTDPVCYSVADKGCTGTCSSVTDWTEAAPAECKFDVSCIDDMVDDKDPASVCTGLTGNENECGAELAPCPATRNLAGFPGADGCGECFELKKGTTTIHAQMMGKIDITGKINAPAVKYFLSSKGLETLGSLSSVPTCYKIDDTAAGASKVEDVTEPGKYGVCDAGSNVGCQSTMGTDTDPEDQCKDQGDGDLEACGEEAKPCPLIANIADVATAQRCGECLTLEKADRTKKHFEILGKVKVEGNRPENKFYTSPEGLKALGESNPTCYVKETDAACTSCTQIKVAEDDATCPTRTTAAVTTTKAGAAQLNVGVAVAAVAVIYAAV